MIEKIKISLWDFFSFFVTGLLIILILAAFGLLPTFHFNPKELLFMSSLIFLVVCYIVGLVFEPISNLTFSVIRKLYNRFPWNSKINTLTIESNLLKEIVETKISTRLDLPEKNVDYFQFAKSLSIKNVDSNLFMVFLSRFGLYRNLSVMLLFILPALLAQKEINENWTSILTAVIAVLFLFVLLFNRAQQFFLYSGLEVYRNYLIFDKKELKEN